MKRFFRKDEPLNRTSSVIRGEKCWFKLRFTSISFKCLSNLTISSLKSFGEIIANKNTISNLMCSRGRYKLLNLQFIKIVVRLFFNKHVLSIRYLYNWYYIRIIQISMFFRMIMDFISHKGAYYIIPYSQGNYRISSP